jgi:cytochrome c553
MTTPIWGGVVTIPIGAVGFGAGLEETQMMKNKWLAAASLSLGCLLSMSANAGDAAKGKAKAETCTGCHAVDSYMNVYPTYNVPKIGGQHAEYIVAALKAYKSGERAHKTMHANAINLSDEDMADIAAYFASLGGAPATAAK